MLTGNDSLLHGIHTTNRRAVPVSDLLVPGTDALDPSYLLRGAVVGGPDHMSLIGASCRQNPFEIEAGYDVFEFAISVFLLGPGIKDIETGGQDDRSHVDLLFGRLHLIVNGAGRAILLA